MTTVQKTPIAQDDALVIDLREFGCSARGAEMEQFFAEFCRRNSQSHWQFELTPSGEIIILAPTNYPSGLHENEIATELNYWCRSFGGMATGANSFCRMPETGGVLVPDAAWVSAERLAAHPPVPGQPIPVCPDFVVEIRSGSDRLEPLHAKMRLYRENGAKLGWLIDPSNRRVHVYRAGEDEAELLEDPATISGEGILPGFMFDVARWIFDRG